MKIFIWIAAFFCVGVIIGLFRSQGIILGGLPTVLFYGAATVIANDLCKRWDKSHSSPDDEEEK